MSRWITTGAALIAAYLLIAYLILPEFWKKVEDERDADRAASPAAPDSSPSFAHDHDGRQAGPINLELVGDRDQLIHALLVSGWQPADPITFETSIGIARSVVLHRPDPDAPVSNLYLFGRRQDLAFEREVGSSANRRHHSRWWLSDVEADDDRPIWYGAASMDARAGLSRRTGQVTHLISPDIDAERDFLMESLEQAGQLLRQYEVMGVGPVEDGRNAEGSRYFTDGLRSVGILVVGRPNENAAQPAP